LVKSTKLIKFWVFGIWRSEERLLNAEKEEDISDHTTFYGLRKSNKYGFYKFEYTNSMSNKFK